MAKPAIDSARPRLSWMQGSLGLSDSAFLINPNGFDVLLLPCKVNSKARVGASVVRVTLYDGLPG